MKTERPEFGYCTISALNVIKNTFVYVIVYDEYWMVGQMSSIPATTGELIVVSRDFVTKLYNKGEFIRSIRKV